MSKTYYVYVMASGKNGTLYIGVTSDLLRRAFQHRQGLIEGFSKKYGTKALVHYEVTEDVRSAIAREKLLKKWNRSWKIDLIKSTNPHWHDLYDMISGFPGQAGE